VATVDTGRRARRAVRLRLGLDANPLRRASDRVESWIRLGLLTAFLAAGPFAAIGASHWMENAGLREARAQAAAERQVRATLLQSAPAIRTLVPYTRNVLAWVPARWAAPGGSPRTGKVSAALPALAGSSVTIWTTASGRLATPPLPRSQVAGRAAAIGALTPAFLAVALLGLLRLSRRVLDRRRLAGWTAAWSAIGPQWTGRR
jgi:hypothetical protein